MSDKPTGDAVQPHPPAPYSEPVAGHGGTKYENVDAKPGLVLFSLACIGGTLVVVFLMTIGFHKLLEHDNPVGLPDSPLATQRVVPPAPQIQVHPWEDLPDMRAEETRILSLGGKDAGGIVHVPIAQSMTAVVPRLNIRPDAPAGIYTPGGQGRDFAGSLHDMPAPYTTPRIQGEIRKNAQ